MPELRPYQRDALNRIAAAEARGVRRQLVHMATGLGKAQPIDEPVLTPSGWRPIGDLRVGDDVIGSDGCPTAVVGVYPQGLRPVAKVTFSDGAQVRCDPDHLWAVKDKYDVHKGRLWRVMRTADLGSRRWRVPMVAPVHQDEWPIPLDPYLLGVLLGDGGLSIPGQVRLHTEHELAATLDLPAPCTLTLQSQDGPAQVAGTYIIGGPAGRSPNPVLTACRRLGLEGSRATDKRIPHEYLHAGPEARLALLRGLMDADGHVRTDGHVELILANEGLIDDAAALVRSLGGTARKASKSTSWTHLGQRKTGMAWRLTIAMTQCPFRWKANRWRPRTKYPPTRFISAVTADGHAESVCIAVAAPDNLYVTTDYVVTHNTVVFVQLARERGGRTLILAHRDELIQQAADKVRQWWPGADVGIVKAGANEVRSQVVVASIQTLARARRLAQLTAPYTDGGLLSAAAPFDLVVVDECHHSAADTYRAVISALRPGAPGCDCGQPHERLATPDEVDAGHELGIAYDPCPGAAGPLLLGVTATPDRGDGKGLDDIFDEIVSSHDILWGIRSGYLSDLRGMRVQLDRLDLTQVKVRRGDYEAGAAGRALEDAGAPELIVAAWLEHALGRRTLVFTPTVELARQCAEAFTAAGVTAGFVHGGTPMDERRQLLADYAAGRISVLANCAVLTEGFDEPRTDCIVMARPTKSRALYTQCIGRGTRRHPDKTDALILDVVGATALHSLVTIPSLFGLEGEWADRLGDGTGAAAQVVAGQEQELLRLGRLRAEEVELFTQLRGEGIAWVQVHEDGAPLRRYVRPLGRAQDGTQLPTVVLAQRGPDEWTAGLLTPTGQKSVLLAEVTMEYAQGVAEDYIRRHGVSHLTAADAPWRARKPSPKAVAAAKKWRLTVDPGWTAGELSEALDAHIARIKSRA